MALSGLDSALSGLRVAQQQLNVISNNVSNVNTDGYTRKILPQATVAIEGETIGVRGNPIMRKVDLNLERDLWTQVSSVSALDTKATYLNRIQQFHGDPSLEISVAAELAQLKDAFSSLADSPEDNFLQRNVVDQANVFAKKVRDFASLLDQMRNDAQDQIQVAVNNVNEKLQQIADLNKQVKFNQVSGKTTAALEDQRDQAIKELSAEMEITFFTRGDGVMVVQTAQGVQLADERAETVYFNKQVLGPTTYYPDPLNPTENAIYVGGDPVDFPNSIEITQSGIGGEIGALIELRDEILPRQQALIDELAHKTALRFNDQGLRLFTDDSGQIPGDTPPDPSTLPSPTPVEYVGFSTVFRVNAAVENDNSLVQQGTVSTDLPVQEGSNEVIRRIIEFTFGDVQYQQAISSVDLRASGSGETLQDWLGIYSQNQIQSTLDLTEYSSLATIINASGDIIQAPNDTFRLSFAEARTGISEPPLAAGDLDFDINLTAADLQPGLNAAERLAAEINAQVAARVGAVPQVADLDIVASVNGYGQLVIESRGDITVDAGFAGGMSAEGLTYLGLSEGTSVTTDPYIDIQVGNDDPTRITIEPGEDENDLIAKLEKVGATDPGVPGLAVDFDVATGFLSIRPGDDTLNPTFGGDIKIVGSSFQADGTGTIGGGMAAGTGIVAALFGAADPVTNVGYTSETIAGSGNFAAFRRENLGQGADISTGIISSDNLIDYAQKLVNRQTEESIAVEAALEDETSFRDLLQRRFLDDSAVNIEEELSHMIVVQSAFAAAARVISAIDENFQELLNAVR